MEYGLISPDSCSKMDLNAVPENPEKGKSYNKLRKYPDCALINRNGILLSPLEPID